MTSTSGNPFCEHDGVQLCPQRARSTQTTPPPAELRWAGFRERTASRCRCYSASWLTAPPRSRLERTGWQPSWRHASTAAVVRRVVAQFVVPLAVSHVEAANVVASRSSVSSNAAGGAVSLGFDQCTSSRATVAGKVGARHSTGETERTRTHSERNGMGSGGMRRARRGLARRVADGAGRGRTSHCGARRMGRDAAVHGGADGAGRCVTSRGAGPTGA